MVGWKRFSKPKSLHQQERDQAARRQYEDSLPPSDGWPGHYHVTTEGMGYDRKAVHRCTHCGACDKFRLQRGESAGMSRSFALAHKGCSKPKATAEASDGL